MKLNEITYRQSFLSFIDIKHAYMILIFLTLTFVSACNEANFKGEQGNKEPLSEDQRIGNASIVEEVTVSLNKVEEANGVADIIFLFDTSSSMDSERKKLEENMALFLSKFRDGSGIIDYQVIMIGREFIFPDIANGRYEIVDRLVDSHDALNVLKDFLQNPNLNRLKLRPEAVKEVVIVSDDNADMHPRDFEAWIRGQQNSGSLGRVHINGFVGLPQSQQNSWCKISSPGSAYSDLAAHPIIGGLLQDLCTEDWSQLVTSLADQIIVSNVTTELALNKKIDPSAPIEVFIDGRQVPPVHTMINYERNMIVLDGTVKTRPGDKVSVKYNSID